MGPLNFKDGFVMVVSILPKELANNILNQAIPENIHTHVLINARGTIYKDKWYQRLTPSISPEQTIHEVLVPESYADAMMDNICKAANLQGGGTGIIYSIKCEKVLFTKDFDFGEANGLLEETVPYKRNLIGIFCIVQKDKAEQIAIAAIRAGSHGPTVVYGQGRGISERLGLMRIAISPEKELIRVIVDHYDVEAIFEAMVQEGKLNTPGMGFIYTMPVEKGLVNIASIATGKNQLAHQYQIIKAIDELKGGSSWRTQRAGINKKQRAHLKNLCRLTCVTARGQGDSLIQVAIDAGAPGASVSYGIEGETERTTSPAIWLNREVEVIEMTVSPQRVDEIIFAMLAATEEKENSNNYFYVQQVSKALTYLE